MSSQATSSSLASGWPLISSSRNGTHVAVSALTAAPTMTGFEVAPVAPLRTASASSGTAQESFQKSAPSATVARIFPEEGAGLGDEAAGVGSVIGVNDRTAGPG